MRELVLTPKFRRTYRKLVKRDRVRQGHIDEVLKQMQADVFAPALGTHKLEEKSNHASSERCPSTKPNVQRYATRQ